MKIVIINYDSGNVASVFNAFSEIANSYQIIISNKISDIKQADFLVLPGVGAFGDCVKSLSKIDNLINEIKYQIIEKEKPFLGICVGMQVLASRGMENGDHQGLDLIPGIVKEIPKNGYKIPHMGWNNIDILQQSKIIKNINKNEHFYFANSYYFQPNDQGNIIAQIDYSIKMPVIIEKNNITAIQFHPEKSSKQGLQILENFLT